MKARNYPITICLVALCVLVHVSTARAQDEKEGQDRSSRSSAIEAGWPDTPVGLMAAGWVDAFSTDEDAMVDFLSENLMEGALDERPMTERVRSYRKLRERFGYLMLGSVVESSADELTVVLLAEDASKHRFIFNVEKDAPHKLVTVGIMTHGHGGGH